LAPINDVKRMHLKFFVAMCALLVSLGAIAAESGAPDGAADSPLPASHGLIADLQSFLREQGVDANHLNAEAMVRLMVDWYRFAPAHEGAGTAAGDTLVYRYGGWSEGCATAFKLSLLRRVTEHDATGAETQRFAGITLMFEPSGQAELMPFTAVASDSKSIEAFLQTIESSPAFRQLASATPMGVVIESGGVR